MSGGCRCCKQVDGDEILLTNQETGDRGEQVRQSPWAEEGIDDESLGAKIVMTESTDEHSLSEAIKEYKSKNPSEDEKKKEEERKAEELKEERERKAAEAQEKIAARKREDAKRKQELRDKMDEERKKEEEKKLEDDALASYVGQWVLAKADPIKADPKAPDHNQGYKQGSAYIDVDVATIDKEGKMKWAHEHSQGRFCQIVVMPGAILQIHLDGENHTACLIGGKEDSFLQRLRWNDGEVWARKGPTLSEYDGRWRRLNDDGTFQAMGEIKKGILNWADHYGFHKNKPLLLERAPGGALFAQDDLRLHKQEESSNLHWVILEKDPCDMNLQRLRWSDGDIWYREDQECRKV